MATLSEEQLTDAVKQEAALRRVAVLVEGADLAEQAAEKIRGAPLELIIDAVSGEPVAQACLLCLRIGGPIASYTARNRQPLSISVLDLIFRELSIYGYWLNRWLASTRQGNDRQHLPRAHCPKGHPGRAGRSDLPAFAVPGSDRARRPKRSPRKVLLTFQ